ncbi:Hypothetical protein CINCED_3A008536 [Cinara cedri]|uniref:Uncharacterized protein n=1 Tax=Cinara cedri TaxID=506608 RepID=A0A5E4MLI0_9HEMI|nr:Hypothetical protein CINCED_3A008536 [Cinara cedri]
MFRHQEKAACLGAFPDGASNEPTECDPIQSAGRDERLTRTAAATTDQQPTWNRAVRLPYPVVIPCDAAASHCRWAVANCVPCPRKFRVDLHTRGCGFVSVGSNFLTPVDAPRSMYLYARMCAF